MNRRCAAILVLLAFACSLASAQEPTRTADRLAVADQHFDAGRFGEARRLYETFLEEGTTDVPYERLHRTYLALGLAEQARSLALRRRSAGLEDPWPGAWHCDMGMIAIQAGAMDELLGQIEALSEIDATLQPHRDPRTLECLAFHEVFARRFSEAQQHLEWLAAHESFDEPPPNLAFLYLRRGLVKQAERILSIAERQAADAAASKPDDPEPHFELAEFAAMRGDSSAAVASLAEAMARGLGQSWWIFQLFDPEALHDPVFEPIYGHPGFERMRASVVDERKRMAEPGTIKVPE